MVTDELKYTREHEWIKVQGGTAIIGITAYAQESLGDVVFIELPEEGRELSIGDVLAVVESVKAVSDVYSPCKGKVAAVNETLLDTPELINQDPYGDGWIVKVEIDELDKGLLTDEEYEKLLEEAE